MCATPARATGKPRLGHLAGTTLLLAASFVLSRLLGVVRTVVIADVFGNSGPINAYFAAFRIPDTMFTLVSGGALATALIPVFSSSLQRGEVDEGWEVASTVFNAVAISLAALALIAFVLAPELMGFLAGGYGPAQRSLTVDLTRIMLLQPIFLGMSAVVSALLQSYRRFVLTAVAPPIYNVAVIIGALLGHSHGVVGLAWFVVIGAVAQLLVQLPGLVPEARGRYRLLVDRDSPGAHEVLRLFVPRVIGLAAFQAMLFITLFLATRLPRGMYGAINYAWLLIAFPVGALGTAAGTAIFPTLSRLSAAEDTAAIRRTVNRSLRFVLFLACPAAAGLIVLRRPVVNLLYHHGAWVIQDTENTAFALLFYSMAIAQLAAIEVLPRVFYAMKDTVTPVRIAVIAVAVDAVLSVVFVRLLPASSGQGGLALATVVATTIQGVWLAMRLNGEIGGIGLRSIAGTLRDSAIASFLMGVILYVLLAALTAILPQRGIGVFITVAFEVGIGAAAFIAITYYVGAPELGEVVGFMRRR